MTNTMELKVAILKSELSRKEIASILGISMVSLHRKINNKVEFKASEIAMLSEILAISDKERIFFWTLS